MPDKIGKAMKSPILTMLSSIDRRTLAGVTGGGAGRLKAVVLSGFIASDIQLSSEAHMTDEAASPRHRPKRADLTSKV
jgi:hypothetical protein